MNDKEFAKAQASIMNKKTKLVQLKDDRAEACKKINEIEQEIAKTENELLEEESKPGFRCRSSTNGKAMC